MKEIEEIVRKIRVGEGLNDAELDKGLDFFLDMEKGLAVLGPTFHLAWKECASTVILLQGFKHAREQARKPSPLAHIPHD